MDPSFMHPFLQAECYEVIDLPIPAYASHSEPPRWSFCCLLSLSPLLYFLQMPWSCPFPLPEVSLGVGTHQLVSSTFSHEKMECSIHKAL